ncbi:MAG: hypothetical protein JST39_23465, partial [Bacteroidetes bacterium]|nr:hypothetical protein [Bacteroidota bacterium]
MINIQCSMFNARRGRLPAWAFVILSAVPATAQLQVSAGAYWNHSGNVYTVLSDVDLVNNGHWAPVSGTVKFTGTHNNSLAGSSAPVFYDLEMAKSGTNTLFLLQGCTAAHSIFFSSGLIDLYGQVITLSPGALLVNESESSRITGTAGGYITTTATLNAPAGVNPGNLGATISTAQNMGATSIRRGHQSQQNLFGNGSSIYRYFDISPANNTALNATLRFRYFDAELNGLAESSLVVFSSPDNTSWQNRGYSARDASANYVDRDAVAGFARWTLSSATNALPVVFASVGIQCTGNTAVVRWQTAQEQHSSRFEVEKSSDGWHWQVLGSLAAAGNSNDLRSYAYSDPAPAAGSFYRIAEYDIDQRVVYSSIAAGDCGGGNIARVWPNPFSGSVSVGITASGNSTLLLKVYNQQGALITAVQQEIHSGVNQATL